MCPAHCGSFWRLQDRHRKEHSPGPSCWEYQADIWCQHQTKPQLTSAFISHFCNSRALMYEVLWVCKRFLCCRCCPTQSSLQKEQQWGTLKSQIASWLVEMKLQKVRGQSGLCVPSMNTGFPNHESSPPTHGRLSCPNWWVLWAYTEYLMDYLPKNRRPHFQLVCHTDKCFRIDSEIWAKKVFVQLDL